MIVASICYSISTVGLIVGLLLVKKSDTRQNIITWVPVSIMLVFCIDAFLAGIINLCSVPVNIISLTVINALLLCVFFCRIIVSKQRQLYRAQISDFIAMAMCLVAVLACGYMQFGTALDINYATSDPSIHLKLALDVVNTDSVSSMYFASVIIAMAIEAMSPFLATTDYYIVFIVCDLLFFFLSGAMFYAVVKRFTKSIRSTVLMIVLMLFYMLGYPLNNLIFGFSYLGTGVTLVALLCFGVSHYLHKDIFTWQSVAICALALFGVMISYALFVPFVYLATLITFLISFRRQGRVFRKNNLLILIVLFLPSVILGFVYPFLGIFGGDLTVAGAIGTEGYIYRDLYSNFIFIAPLFLYAFYDSIKNKLLSLENCLFTVVLIGMVAFLALGLLGYISSYYFYKLYYLMWLVTFIMAAKGVAVLVESDARRFLLTYCSVWLAIALLAVSGIDSKINIKNVYFNHQVKAWEYLDIYAFNRNELQSDTTFSKDKLTLFEQAFSYKTENNLVPLVADWEDIYWYQAITNQPMDNYYAWILSENVYSESLARVDYFAVISGSEAEKMAQSEIANAEVVYSNSAGYIVRVADRP